MQKRNENHRHEEESFENEVPGESKNETSQEYTSSQPHELSYSILIDES